MSTKICFRIFAFILLAGLLLSLTRPGIAQAPAMAFADDPYAKIEAQLFDELATKGQADFFIHLESKADLSAAASLPAKAQKGEFVFNALRAHADAAQADLRAFLDAQGVKYTAFYIANTILVRGGSQDLVLAVASRPEVARLTANHTYQIEKPKVGPVSPPQSPNGVEPNISFVNADDVWAQGFTGQGIVLADDSTGLDWTHPAIQPHYRGWNGATADHNYNWYDVTGTYPDEPMDVLGPGSMFSGIMVGADGADNQIGMAPGAKTIHCKSVYDDWSSTDATFLTCLEWDLAPWDLTGANPRPDLAPDAVNFTWPHGDYDGLRDAVDNLSAAGILVAAQTSSTSEMGEGCSTVSSPGNYPEVLGIGSVLYGDGTLPGILDDSNARGPSPIDGGFEPDILAPGENIRSSYPGGDYLFWGGNGFATPHVPGLVGLMWSANPTLRGQVEDTMQIIKDTAVPLTGQTGSNCGGDYITGPNNEWGYGTIDALAAVQAAIAYGGEAGTLQGTVTDAVSGDPIPRVDIHATLSPTQTYQIFTDVSGEYTLDVVAGTYTMDASAFGYAPEQVIGVTVEDGITVTQDFDLDLLPTHVLSVTVVDANTGWPLYAISRLVDTPLAAIWNDPLTGRFVTSVPEGVSFMLRTDVWTPGYLHQEIPVGPVMGDTDLLVEMEPDLGACNAPGYEFILDSTVLTEDFELSDGGYTITGTNPSWEWVSPYAGPYAAHSGSMAWATDLYTDNYMGYPATYFDDEHSYIVSPPIDLSSYSGSSFNLGWWQWLQTEECCDYGALQVTKDGGVTWRTVYGRMYGDVDLYWADQAVGLDPSYAVSDFQFRFNLESDWGMVYPGWYVDDVALQAGECLPMAGGLVVGNVYDANDGLPLVEATVENDSGFSTLTTPTEDEAIDDAFYVLFSSGGLHDFTASMEDYAPELQAVDVLAGDAVWQDFYMEAGMVTADTLSLEATIELGNSATISFNLMNEGGADAHFNLAEMGGSFDPLLAGATLARDIPGSPAAQPEDLDIFIICNDWSPICEPFASQMNAFGDLGSITAHDDNSGVPTLEELLNFDVVVTWAIIDFADPEGLGDVLADYVDAGRKVVYFNSGIYGTEMGGRFAEEDYSAYEASSFHMYTDCMGSFDATHPIMQSVTEVCDYYRSGGTTLTPGSTLVASYLDGAILAAVKDNRSVVTINVYVGEGPAWSGQVDVLAHNAILWLTGEEIPWLIELPITGTLQAETGIQNVSVTFDSSVPETAQPGVYNGVLKVTSDTPYRPIFLPVTMTVTAPANYGMLEGTVHGLGYCDVDPAALYNATIQVESGTGKTWTLKTDEIGHYQVWMDAVNSPVTVTVSADEYLPDSAMGVVVESGEAVTTQDFDLRWNKPCVNVTPATLEVNVQLGYEKDVEIQIDNQGAAEATFELYEVEGGLASHFTMLQVPIYNVLLLAPDTSNGDNSRLLDALAVYPDLIVSIWNNSQGNPTAADLEPYDVVIFGIGYDIGWETAGLDGTAIGNAIADYLDAGGKAIEAQIISFSGSFGGRYITDGYSPFTTAPDWYDGWLSIDVVDPTHPVMQGVSELWTWSHLNVGLAEGAVLLATASDIGYSAVAANANVVGVNISFFNAVWGGAWDGQIGLLLNNAVTWLSGETAEDLPWLSEDPITGTLNLDSSSVVNVTFTTIPTMTVGDVYTAWLVLTNDDAANPKIKILVTMHVVAPTLYMPVIWKSNP